LKSIDASFDELLADIQKTLKTNSANWVTVAGVEVAYENALVSLPQYLLTSLDL
jgi:hypothetical protein